MRKMQSSFYGKFRAVPPKNRPNWVCPVASQLDLLYLGWGYRRYADYRWPLQRHEGNLYLYYISGAPSLVTPAGKFQIQSRELILIDRECAVSWTDTPGRTCRMLSWIWRTPPNFPVLTPAPGKWRRFRLDRGTARELAKLHEACRNEVIHLNLETKLSLQALHVQLDVILSRYLRPSSMPLSSSGLDLAIQWLNAHLDSECPVDELCDYLQVSPATLNRLFHSHLKTSVKRFFYERRMLKAHQLLREEKLSVKETAYHLGYKHSNDLSRAYRNYWKVAATEG